MRGLEFYSGPFPVQQMLVTTEPYLQPTYLDFKLIGWIKTCREPGKVAIDKELENLEKKQSL